MRHDTKAYVWKKNLERRKEDRRKKVVDGIIIKDYDRRKEEEKDSPYNGTERRSSEDIRSGKDRRFSYDLPTVIKSSEKYIFFLHGKIVEKHGPNGIHPLFGIYDYHGIVKSIANCGFTVISEIRPEGTKPDKYAGKIVRQIKTLLTNGIPPEQITVAGFSKGATISLLVSSKLRNPVVNFVVMSGCSDDGTHVWKHYNKLIDQSIQFIQGRFLYIYDISVQKCDICQRILKNTSNETTFNEIKVKNGLSHSLFYRPRRDWLEPIVEWIDQK